MNNEEKTKIAIEYLTELRDSRQKVLPNSEAEKDVDIFNMAIKALEDIEEKEKVYDNSEVWLCPKCKLDMRGKEAEND